MDPLVWVDCWPPRNRFHVFKNLAKFFNSDFLRNIIWAQMNFHLLHFGCSFRFGVGHRLSGRKPLPVNIPTERKRPDKRCFRFSEFCTWSEAIFLTLGLSELVSMLHRKMFFGWMTPKRVTGSIWSAHSSSRVTRRVCTAQRKQFSHPAARGSNPGSANIFSLYCLVCEQ